MAPHPQFRQCVNQNSYQPLHTPKSDCISAGHGRSPGQPAALRRPQRRPGGSGAAARAAGATAALLRACVQAVGSRSSSRDRQAGPGAAAASSRRAARSLAAAARSRRKRDCPAEPQRRSGAGSSPGAAQPSQPRAQQLGLPAPLDAAGPCQLHSTGSPDAAAAAGCTLVGIAGGIGGLSALASLRHLALSDVSDWSLSWQQKVAALDAALRHLVQLTTLDLDNLSNLAGPFSQLSCLVRLQELVLNPWDGCEEAMSALPASITSLCLRTIDESVLLTRSTTAGLTRLTALQRLRFDFPVISFDDHKPIAILEPALLAVLPALQQLDVHGGGKTFLPEFLVACPGLTHLRHLRLLIDMENDMPAVQQFTAIARLSRLSHLELHNDCFRTWPAGAARHLFSGAFPELRVLGLSPEDFQSAASPMEPCLLDTRDLQRLVAACPGLLELDLQLVLEPATQLHSLLRLSALTKLQLAGDGTSDSALEQVVCRMSRLLELTLHQEHMHAVYNYAGLWHLTALTQLTRFAHTVTPDSRDKSGDCTYERTGADDDQGFQQHLQHWITERSPGTGARAAQARAAQAAQLSAQLAGGPGTSAAVEWLEQQGLR